MARIEDEARVPDLEAGRHDGNNPDKATSSWLPLDAAEAAEACRLLPGQDLPDTRVESSEARAFLLVTMVSPCLLVYVFLHLTRSAWLAATSFHAVSCLFLPWVFLCQHRQRDGVWDFLRSLRVRDRRQVYAAASVVFATAGVMFLAYLVVRRVVPNIGTELSEYGLSKQAPVSLAMFCVYFTTVNPVLEEWMWRAFMLQFYGRSRGDRVISAVWYAAYHIVVLALFWPVWLLVLVFVSLIGAGLMFSIVTERFGFVVSIGLHCGADIGIVLILLNMLFAFA